MAETNIANQVNSTSDGKARFGAFLRQARENAGISIEAVAQETKISKQFIIYLESGRVENLPGQVFGRGFIKNIARYLRSDSGEMLRLYDACWGIVTETKPDTAPIPDKAQSPIETEVKRSTDTVMTPERQAAASIPDIPHLPSVDTGRRRYGVPVPTWLVRSVMSPHVRLSILGVVAAVMVVGVLGRWIAANYKNADVSPRTATPVETAPKVMHQESGVDASNPASTTATTELVAPEDVPANIVERSISVPADTAVTKPTATVVETAVNKTAVQEESPLQVQEGGAVAFDQVMELNISAPVEIKMILDGKKVENTSYKADQHRFTFHERAELMISDASVVDIVYNGKSLGVLGNKGRKRRIFFQAKPSESDFPH